ncbi:hypothetical protein [Streptomyces sp. NBC_00582]|uniref:hypothetical protein n=1 Tax=Streptomyces sp. NBC_00582 TaxID=2975783 RepID=UPI002E803C42|nr:hypothetical protein [Streptomyces sp. NBC_00582]WUB61525.1 hypothetical protein OG852_14550 [Streptomyces sp. NBC_00582]
MTAQTLTLFSRSLLSKWGFNDGDTPDAWMDWCDSEGIDWPQLDFPLVALVREHLVPAITQNVSVVEIETSHNPIRVETIDGTDVRPVWTGLVDEPTLTPESVDVPMTEVLRVALAEKGLTEAPRYVPPL